MRNLYQKYLKRTIDVALSGSALLLMAVPIAGIGLWLHFSNEGAGVFFSQQRPGKRGKIFKLFKFKSMNDAKDKNGNLLPDKQRLTKAGKFIRATSIDELPQLWNVLKGDMSLIGPRPLLPRYLPWYTEREQLRHTVRPGITGWAQVNGRNLVGWDEKLEMDAWYTENLSFALDCKIIYRTILNVIQRKDVIADKKENYMDIEREMRLKSKEVKK